MNTKKAYNDYDSQVITYAPPVDWRPWVMLPMIALVVLAVVRVRAKLAGLRQAV